MKNTTGWKPMPIQLKVVFILNIIWAFGTLSSLQMMHQLGLPLFGSFIYGYSANIVQLIWDIIAPLSLCYALWYAKSWGTKLALTYLGLFLLNGAIAFALFRQQLGLAMILMPNLIALVLLILVYTKRNYLT